MKSFLSNLFLMPGPKPSLVGSDKAEKKATKSPVRRILRPGYICDIIRDEHTDPAIHHWVVQDCDTDEIIGLGQAHSLPEAELHALAFLNDMRIRRAI